ncbi:MAG TPA: pimeloyl-CoA dehydrogenase large subunit, partial [Alphaproteobacteria bacterium]|nr:pimeloyl-CoA dehydrogenase large subunit [Alphaproteobacteria bacterium]
SFLLIDMKTPGIEVKPIISIDGLHHLNETFFTDVRVPAANRIGEEGKGWT